MLECQGQNFCDPIITISNFLKTGHVFSSKDVLITVEEQGSVVFETTFEDYLNNYWLPYDGYPEQPSQVNSHADTALHLGDNNSPMDGALHCNYDPDYTCDDWREDPLWGDFLTDIMFRIDNNPVTIEVTQEWIDSENEFRASIITAALYFPIDKISSL